MDSNKRVYLKVRVQPRAPQKKIQKIGDREYKVWVVSPPSEGRANNEVIHVVASHFRIPPSRIKISRGGKSRQKILILEY